MWPDPNEQLLLLASVTPAKCSWQQAADVAAGNVDNFKVPTRMYDVISCLPPSHYDWNALTQFVYLLKLLFSSIIKCERDGKLYCCCWFRFLSAFPAFLPQLLFNFTCNLWGSSICHCVFCYCHWLGNFPYTVYACVCVCVYVWLYRSQPCPALISFCILIVPFWIQGNRATHAIWRHNSIYI